MKLSGIGQIDFLELFLGTVKTMVLVSNATMEADKWEDKARPLPFKPVVLPPITMTMKKA